MEKGLSILVASQHFFVECSWKYLSEQVAFPFSNMINVQNQADFEQKTMIHQPQVIVIDVDSKNFNLKKSLAFVDITIQSKVIFTGKLQSVDFYEEYKHLNVSLFISNSIGKEELMEVLGKIAIKKVLFSKEVTAHLAFEKTQVPKTNSFIQQFNISDRELDIIKLIAEGFINKEIADKLFISTHTVNTHRKNIMQKLGINNTAGIVLFAVKEGLVSPNDFLFSSK